jgi:hypothetical protein
MAPSNLKANGLTPLSELAVSPEIQVEDDVHKDPISEQSSALSFLGKYATPTRAKEVLRPKRHEKEQGSSTFHQPTRTANTCTSENLSEEQPMLCNSHVAGYSLKDKTWGAFAVVDVKEVSWNDDAFPSLILPQGHKDLILAFVDGQLSQDHAFDDVIKGKGQGLTILLAGTPGTGKTLTAEAVADKVRRPLYVLSAGELGQDAVRMEKKLKSTLDLTEKWGAVLLLDECDVFLEKRSHDNLNHNEVVAVFLR